MAFNLMSLLGLMSGDHPGPVDSGPSAPVTPPTSPEEALSGVGLPSSQPSAPPSGGGGINGQDFAMRFLMGRMIGDAMRGQGGGGGYGMAAMMRMMQEQRIRQQQNIVMSKGVQAVQDALAKGDVDNAAGLVEQLGATGYLSEQGAKSLGSMIDRARALKATRDSQLGFLKARAIYQQAEQQKPGSGQDAIAAAIQSDPAFASQIAAYQGGPNALFKELAPATSVTNDQVVQTPSPALGGQPRIVPIPKFEMTDAGKKVLTGKFGVTQDMATAMLRSGDPQQVEKIHGLMAAAESVGYANDAFTRMKLRPELAEVLPSIKQPDGRPVNPQEVAQMLESDNTADRQRATAMIDQARDLLRQRDLQDKLKVAAESTMAKRQAIAGDRYEPKGMEVWDRNSRTATEITNGQNWNVRNWYTPDNPGGRYVEVSKQEGQQLRLIQGAFPIADALERLSNRLLSAAQGGNLPSGAATEFKKIMGSADAAQFNQLREYLKLEGGRILGGSVRIPVTMLKMLDGTSPTTYSSLQAAQREIQTFRTDLNNRFEAVMRTPQGQMSPIPTGPSGTTTLSSGKTFKMPGAK